MRKSLISPELMDTLCTRDHEGNRLRVEWGDPDAEGFYVPTIHVDYTENPLRKPAANLVDLLPRGYPRLGREVVVAQPLRQDGFQGLKDDLGIRHRVRLPLGSGAASLNQSGLSLEAPAGRADP